MARPSVLPEGKRRDVAHSRMTAMTAMEAALTKRISAFSGRRNFRLFGKEGETLHRARLSRFGMVFVALAASAHIIELVIESRHLERSAELELLTSSSFALLQIVFILSFVTFAIGLLIRSFPGLLISILGLVGVVLSYAYWSSHSSRWLFALKRDAFYAEHPDFLPPNFLGLVRATWWDVPILVISILILCWMVKCLFRPSTCEHLEKGVQT